MLNIGYFKASGRHLGEFLKFIIPLKKEFLPNELYFDYWKGFMSETTNGQTLEKCGKTIDTVYNAIENTITKSF